MTEIPLDPTPARPKLRSDVRIEAAAEGNFVARIVDERLGKRVKLDRTALAIARLLDGRRDAGALLVKLDDDGLRIRPALLRKVLEFFERQLLLEGAAFERATARIPAPPAEERVVLKADSLEIPSDARVFFLEEARHGCTGCGLCCTGYELGPISAEEAVRLRTAIFADEGGGGGRGPRVLDKVYKGMAYRALATTEEGTCVFLGRDQRCIVHAELGFAAKPWFCRLFPLHFVSAPDGKIFGHLVMECFGYHAARTRGPLLAEQLDTMSALLALTREVPVLAPHVGVGPSRTLALEDYYAVEDWLLERFKSDPRGPEAALVQAGRFLRHVENGGTAADYTPDPEATALLPNDELALAVCEFARSCLAAVSSAALAGRPDGTSAGMQRAFLDALELFSSEGDAAETAPAVEPEEFNNDPECLAIVREFLRNEVFSKEWYLLGDLRHGYALTVARLLLAGAGACLTAGRGGETRVRANAFCHALSLTLRCMRRKNIQDMEDASPLTRIYAAIADAGTR